MSDSDEIHTESLTDFVRDTEQPAPAFDILSGAERHNHQSKKCRCTQCQMWSDCLWTDQIGLRKELASRSDLGCVTGALTSVA